MRVSFYDGLGDARQHHRGRSKKPRGHRQHCRCVVCVHRRRPRGHGRHLGRRHRKMGRKLGAASRKASRVCNALLRRGRIHNLGSCFRRELKHLLSK
jgi:hypothetical protein